MSIYSEAKTNNNRITLCGCCDKHNFGRRDKKTIYLWDPAKMKEKRKKVVLLPIDV